MTASAYRLLFPYCLQRQPDGSYVALNRNYEPLGSMNNEWGRNASKSARFKFARLQPATVRALASDGSEDRDAIYFYSDGCAPFRRSQVHTEAYFSRLAKLGSLTLVPVD